MGVEQSGEVWLIEGGERTLLRAALRGHCTAPEYHHHFETPLSEILWRIRDFLKSEAYVWVQIQSSAMLFEIHKATSCGSVWNLKPMTKEYKVLS
jgi:hypothetical protein